jgi:hypothetical protein
VTIEALSYFKESALFSEAEKAAIRFSDVLAGDQIKT